MKTHLKDINLKYEELAEKNIANNGVIWERLKEEVFADITEEPEDKIKLKKVEDKYKQLIEYMYEGLGQIDKDEIITYVNPRMTEIFGHTPEEMIGKHFFL